MMAGPMVRRLKDGTKTQTRRTGARWLKVKPGDVLHVREAYAIITCPECDGYGEIVDPKHPDHPSNTGDGEDENWCLRCVRDEYPLQFTEGEVCVYRADGERNDVERWTPAVHMPLSLVRMRLLVKRVWQERADGISEADAIAEGMEGLTVDDLLEMAGGSKRLVINLLHGLQRGRKCSQAYLRESWLYFGKYSWPVMAARERLLLVLAVLGAKPDDMVTAIEFEVQHVDR